MSCFEILNFYIRMPGLVSKDQFRNGTETACGRSRRAF